MKLVFLIGDAAVGKMTVGQELMKQTGLRLFHNHMTIEPVLDIFGAFRGDTILKLREIIFQDFAKTDNYGMIHTIMWAFDMPSDWEYIRHISDIFRQQGGEVYYVELVASQDIRLQRNETPNRLAHKASKRDVAASRERLLRDDRNHRLESLPGEIPFDNYIKIDNSYLEPDVVATMIRTHFAL
ncbi:MAG: shikimate kinase [Oscillospiraceae bacterium]|nr:shikimate kinase [Oscillospiraceae bacterium]